MVGTSFRLFIFNCTATGKKNTVESFEVSNALDHLEERYRIQFPHFTIKEQRYKGSQ